MEGDNDLGGPARRRGPGDPGNRGRGLILDDGSPPRLSDGEEPLSAIRSHPGQEDTHGLGTVGVRH